MPTATSPEQYSAWHEKRVPDPERVRDGIHSVPLPMPGHQPAYTLCYVVEDDRGDVHLIDAGMSSDANWAILGERLRGIGKDVTDVATVTLTHMHPDHLGLAGRIRDASGATVFLHELDRRGLAEQRARTQRTDAATLAGWGVPADRAEAILAEQHREGPLLPAVATEPVADGDVLPVPGRRLEVVHTPGHTTGHICIRDREAGLLFTGDHVMPGIHGGLGLGGRGEANPVADYLASLQRLVPDADREAAPGHEYRFRGLAARLRSAANHHLRRTREVEALADDDLSVWEVASRLTWSAGWQNLTGFRVVSALAQTAMHLAFVRSDEAARWLVD
ncbi:MBL fold metallo-hydrolase [Microbacterium sp.]|uniref:MBL fold metallo-hydrolase n=1 Tax=Microbacterium sp. TaxID=51671 RepID=UPI003A9520B8